jgi:hypothetical protein
MKSDMELALVNAALEFGMVPSVCYFHYAQAIERWIDARHSIWTDSMQKAEIIDRTKCLFHADTPELFISLRDKFEKDLGANSAFWNYYHRQYLMHNFPYRWCKAWTFKNGFFNDDTNNGAESRNNVFRNSVLKRWGTNDNISLTAAMFAMHEDALTNLMELKRCKDNPSNLDVPHGRTEVSRPTERILKANEKAR